MEHIKLRICLGIFLIISLYVLPFWMPLIALAIGVFFIPYYWEALIFLACADLLYLGGDAPWEKYWFPLLAIVIFLAVEVLRGYFRKERGVI